MQIYIGIDWSKEKHDAVFVNEAGAKMAHLSFAHNPEGFEKFDQTRAQFGAAGDCLLALETAHNLLVDFLWARNYTQVYVVPPSIVKGVRKRYRQSGARTDESDAELLGNLLRTDHQRLQPWHPDRGLTRQMRAQISLYLYLSRSCVRLGNRLRSVLLRYYPAALEIFYHLDARITLEFIRAFPTPQKAAALEFEGFQAFAHQHRYPRPGQLVGRYAKLQATRIVAAPETVQAYQNEAVTLATLFLETTKAKLATQKELTRLFAEHPDQAIFASFPGVGEILGPGLLTKFGDDRQRFPTAGSLQALAGTCPVTDWSGKRRVIRFRKACDRDFRHLVGQWARCSLSHSIWANAYFQQIRPRCRSNSHAYRCLGNRWLAIAWKCWQTRQPYDETYHLQNRLKRSKPQK